MESLAHLVSESLLRHGLEPTFDHRRLQWSKWFRCQDSFNLVMAPCKPGLFALGEELAVFCGASEPRSRHPERSEGSPNEGKRMLALFQISEANDLGMALGRLFLSGNPARERFGSGRCFARYVVIEDPVQRRTALTALQRWMASSAEAVSGVPQAISDDNYATRDTEVPSDIHVAPDAHVRGAERSSAGFTSGHDPETAGFVSGHSENAGVVHGHNVDNAGFVSRHDVDEPGFVSGHDFNRAANAALSTAALAAASADASEQPESSNKQAQIGPPMPIPSGF